MALSLSVYISSYHFSFSCCSNSWKKWRRTHRRSVLAGVGAAGDAAAYAAEGPIHQVSPCGCQFKCACVSANMRMNVLATVSKREMPSAHQDCSDWRGRGRGRGGCSAAAGAASGPVAPNSPPEEGEVREEKAEAGEEKKKKKRKAVEVSAANGLDALADYDSNASNSEEEPQELSSKIPPPERAKADAAEEDKAATKGPRGVEKQRRKRVCFHYKRGSCPVGEKCKYSHDVRIFYVSSPYFMRIVEGITQFYSKSTVCSSAGPAHSSTKGMPPYRDFHIFARYHSCSYSCMHAKCNGNGVPYCSACGIL